jgi:serine phosphatase RsbU (regulator of sigma subunit)
VFVYSDGLTDTLNAQGETFGAARLLDATKRVGLVSRDHALRSLVEDLDEFRGEAQPKDDVSILALAVQ